MRHDPETRARIAANMNRLADVKRETPMLVQENIARHNQIMHLKSGSVDHIRNSGLDVAIQDLALIAGLAGIAAMAIIAFLAAIFGLDHGGFRMFIGLPVAVLPIMGVIYVDKNKVGQVSDHLLIAFMMLGVPFGVILIAALIFGLFLGAALFIQSTLAIGAVLGIIIAIITGFFRTRHHIKMLRDKIIPMPENAWEADSDRREELI